MKTLVVHTGALGDFLLACPAIAALAEDGPVELCGHPERHALAVAAGIAQRAHPLDKLGLHEIFADVSHAPARLQQFAYGFDRAIIWMRDPDGRIASALRHAGIADVQCHPGLPQGEGSTHASAYYLHTIGRAPVETFQLLLPPLPGHDIVLAPGSGSPAKNWPLPNFLAIAEDLRKRGRQITWLLGPAEEGIALPSGNPALINPDLVTLGRQLAATKLFVGNDSGPTHLASLVGCPTIAIFGARGLRIWYPIGRQTRVCRANVWPNPAEASAEILTLMGK
jgi:heptosyltransferase-3